MSGSKIHSVQAAAYNIREEDATRRREEAAQRDDGPNPLSGTGVAAAIDHGPSHPRGHLEAVDLGVPGLRVHAPWPGLHEVCKGCGAPSVSGLGSGPQTCEHCPGHVPPVLAGVGKAGGGGTGKQQPAGKIEREVAVTSVREVALSKEHASVLRRTGTVMLGMSSLLFVLLLCAW